ncbi:hypothetical protein GNI_190690, partial [Gregarina niphandrodes]
MGANPSAVRPDVLLHPRRVQHDALSRLIDGDPDGDSDLDKMGLRCFCVQKLDHTALDCPGPKDFMRELP